MILQHMPIEAVPSFAPVPLGPQRDGGDRKFTIVLLFPGHTLTDHLPFGDGLVAFGFIAALARRGHRLHVITRRMALKNRLPTNVTIYPDPSLKATKFDGRFEFLARSRKLVQRLMRTESIDLVHQLNPVCNGMSLGLLGLHIPLILGTFVARWPSDDEATGVVDAWSRPLRRFSREIVLRIQEQRADAFLVTTPAALDALSGSSRVHDRVHQLPNGIDISQFLPLPREQGSDKTILFLASVEKKKGIFTLLDAFQIVRRTIPEAKLIVAGRGSESPDFQEHLRTLPHLGGIEIIGYVDRTAVPQLMARCAVYCLPSFGEPYGMTVLEAMACAKPVVVSNSGGVRDLVSDAAGRRFEPGNVEQLAASLIEILQSPALQEQLGAHNRAKAEREFAWSRVIGKLEGVYEHVVRRATAC